MKRELEDEVKDMLKMYLNEVVTKELVVAVVAVTDEVVVAVVLAVDDDDAVDVVVASDYEDRGSGCVKDCSGYFGLVDVVLNERDCVDDGDADFPNVQGLRYSPPPYTLVRLDVPSVLL